MPVEMFLYLPLGGGASGENMSILDHANEIASIYAKPVEKKEDEEEDDGGYGYRRRGRGGDGLPAELTTFHESKGFCSILAWSHGCSSSATVFNTGRGNMQDISMTKWNDKRSPLIYVAVMRGELLPKAVLRCLHTAKEGKFDVIEYVLENVQCTSLSTGGSGGEDRLTENLTLTFGAMSVRIATVDSASGDIVSDSCGSWDMDTNSGSRDGGATVPSLSIFCRRFFNNNRSLFSRKDLIKIVTKKLVEESEVGIDKSSLSLPNRGRRLLFAQDTKKDRYREAFIHKLDIAAVRAAAVEAFGLKAESLDSIFVSEGSRLVEILKDDQVDSLNEDDSIIFSVKA